MQLQQRKAEAGEGVQAETSKAFPRLGVPSLALPLASFCFPLTTCAFTPRADSINARPLPFCSLSLSPRQSNAWNPFSIKLNQWRFLEELLCPMEGATSLHLYIPLFSTLSIRLPIRLFNDVTTAVTVFFFGGGDLEEVSKSQDQIRSDQ